LAPRRVWVFSPRCSFPVERRRCLRRDHRSGIAWVGALRVIELIDRKVLFWRDE
jgi:hypothetical protein